MTTPTDDLAQALRAIVEWQPPTMKDRDGNDCGMALLIGSNGVRDYFRALAAEALVAHESRAQPASVADDEVRWLLSQITHCELSHDYIKYEKCCDICKRIKRIRAMLAAPQPAKESE